MSLYLKQLEQLVALQKIDHEIFTVQKALEEAPRQVAALEKKFQELSQQHERLLDKIAHIKEQEKRLNLEIDDEAQRIKKRKNQMMSLETGRDYHAMAREMDNMEKLNRSREEEKTLLLEELAHQNEAFQAADEKYQAVRQELDETRASLQARIDESTAILKALGERRKVASADVPAPVFSRYEFIRERLEHPVIVSVEEGVCSGCHIAIPPQSFIELQKGQQILSCPNCRRLIYWCEHFSAPAEAATEKAEE